jgi:hypothetical protein
MGPLPVNYKSVMLYSTGPWYTWKGQFKAFSWVRNPVGQNSKDDS